MPFGAAAPRRRRASASGFGRRARSRSSSCCPTAAARRRCSAADGGWFELESSRPRPGTPTCSPFRTVCRWPDPASRAPGRRRPWALAGGRSRHLPLAAHGVAGPAVARDRPLRAASRHVHARKAPSRVRVDRLPYLAELGVTAVELMPIADFAGSRNWGYDGVLPYRPGPALRHARRAEGADRRGARPRPDGLPRRGLQPLRAGG